MHPGVQHGGHVGSSVSDMQSLKGLFSVYVGSDEKMFEHMRLESREAGGEHYPVIKGRGKRARECVGKDANTEECS